MYFESNATFQATKEPKSPKKGIKKVLFWEFDNRLKVVGKLNRLNGYLLESKPNALAFSTAWRRVLTLSFW